MPRDAPHTPRRRALVSVDRPLVLVGFMGAGKTAVGKKLARALGLEFVDLDVRIEADAQKSVAEIFRDHGEVAFRARERAALRELLDEQAPQVVATGGGCFADATMRGWLLSQAETVYLDASSETLMRRLSEAGEAAKRPLLRGPDPTLTVQRLLKARRTAYEAAELRIHTDDIGVDEVVEHVIRAMEQQRLKPTAKADESEDRLEVESQFGGYSIHFHQEADAWIAETVLTQARSKRVVLLTDDHVEALHADVLQKALETRGGQVSRHVVRPGEGSKSLEVLGEVYDAVLAAGIDRKTMLVALGGGVVGDLGGFVASTVLRGIDFVQVPTTTLAAVDSSVGGKTGINVARGKNLVGAFWAPKAVCVAYGHLRTQDLRQHRAGVAEIVKIAATCNRGFFEWCEREAAALGQMEPTVTLQAVRQAARLKGEVVSRDEREAGERAVLNFGHTVGHALETASGYTMLHGEAVALGMVAELEWAQKQGKSRGIALSRFVALLESLSLPTDWRSYEVDLESLRADKKIDGDQVKLPVLSGVGEYNFINASVASVAGFVRG